MLVLTRARDEEIRIGDEIVVRVLEVKGDRVRIGIQAPMSVPVHRQEVYLEIEEANRQSLDVVGSGLAGVKELLGERGSADKDSAISRLLPTGRRGNGARRKLNTEVTHGT